MSDYKKESLWTQQQSDDSESHVMWPRHKVRFGQDGEH